MFKNGTKQNMTIMLILTIILVSGIISTSYGQALYIKASPWAQPEIQCAYDFGLLPSMLTGADLTKAATREELCELAVLLYEKLSKASLQPVSPNPFTDTKNSNILKAYGIGITTGTTATTFSPSQTTTREQVATMFGRAIKTLYTKLDYSVSSLDVFNDQSQISDYALSHVIFMNKEGIIKGTDGNFMPRPISQENFNTGYGTTTREQAIAISVRIYQRYLSVQLSPDPDAGFTIKPLPGTGIYKDSSQKRTAPFGLVTSKTGQNYFAKLEDSRTGNEVMTFFVRDGERIDTMVPLGSYNIKYATGKDWYGNIFLFGAATEYYKADQTFDFIENNDGISGWTIELIYQTGGNLGIDEINKSNW